MKVKEAVENRLAIIGEFGSVTEEALVQALTLLKRADAVVEAFHGWDGVVYAEANKAYEQAKKECGLS